MSFTTCFIIGAVVVAVLACVLIDNAVTALLRTPEETSGGLIINKIRKAIGNDQKKP
jgi:hypothetical protein